MKIEDIKEWITPTGSYGFSAFETFKGKYFSLRTGKNVSVLELIGSVLEIRLQGKVEVQHEVECFEIAIKLNKIMEVISEIAQKAHHEGRNEIKKEIKNLLTVY